MSSPLTYGSLFTGIGGIDLGLDRAGFTCLWQCESAAYCRALLARHWPSVPRYTHVTDIPSDVTPPFLLAGGFPCQDVSEAGHKAGLKGQRSGLWFSFRHHIRNLRPSYVLIENVPGLLYTKAIATVLADLASLGYDAEWHVLTGRQFGALHKRRRVFIVAYPSSIGCTGIDLFPNRKPQMLPDPHEITLCRTGRYRAFPKSPVLRMAYDVPNRLHAIRALGNAVVPAIAEYLSNLIRMHYATALLHNSPTPSGFSG